MEYQHGMFTWADISAPDPDSAKRFYTGLFGWDAVDEHDPDGNYVYTMFNTGEKRVAGLGPQPPELVAQGMPPMWNSYITVDNLSAAVDGWALAGGQVIMPPMDVFSSGRMAVVADPEGAVVALWQAQEHVGAEVFNTPGAMTWNELNSRDTAAAREFYGKALGWEFEEFPYEGRESYWLVTVPGKQQGQPFSEDAYNGGILAVSDDFPPEFPAYWSVYFTAADLDHDVAKVGELGGSVVAGPMDTSAGRMAVVADPMGAIFVLIQPPEQP